MQGGARRDVGRRRYSVSIALECRGDSPEVRNRNGQQMIRTATLSFMLLATLSILVAAYSFVPA
jgi:hypothetical protein